jgi:hypothetical protein
LLLKAPKVQSKILSYPEKLAIEPYGALSSYKMYTKYPDGN